jgi:hypothetical protein
MGTVQYGVLCGYCGMEYSLLIFLYMLQYEIMTPPY